PVIAWRNGGRAGDAEVHLFGPGIANQAHDFPAGGAANDGVINQHNDFSRKQAAYRVELELDAEVAHALLRLDKSPANIMVANQSEAKRNSSLGRVAQRCRHT